MRWTLRDIPHVVVRITLGMFAVGVLLSGVGTYLDIQGWWQDRPFLTNLVSSVASAMFGIPIALIVLSALSRAVARYASQVSLNDRMIGLTSRFMRELEQCARPGVVRRLKGNVEFEGVPRGNKEDIQDWWPQVREDFELLLVGKPGSPHGLPPDWVPILRMWERLTGVLEEVATMVEIASPMNIAVLDEDQLERIGRTLRHLNQMQVGFRHDPPDTETYPLLINYYFTVSRLLIESRALAKRISALSDALSWRG